jgi:hypothetical protein
MSSFLDESASVDESAALGSEERSVFRWRFEQLLALGFGEGDALQLALSDLDLGLARRLAALACPLELVARICL